MCVDIFVAMVYFVMIFHADEFTWIPQLWYCGFAVVRVGVGLRFMVLDSSERRSKLF